MLLCYCCPGEVVLRPVKAVQVVVGEVGRELLAAVAMADAGGFGAEH